MQQNVPRNDLPLHFIMVVEVTDTVIDITPIVEIPDQGVCFTRNFFVVAFQG